MKVEERNNLLIRLDERVRNIWRVLEEQEDSINKKIDKIIEHNEKQNGKIAKNRLAIVGLTCLLIGAGILEGADIIHIFGG